ncbi:helix-turn-helix transcriptional regulator [Mycobacterium sp. IDR2000157661]|uniref:helix-turn-helix transcriptional regulator n=1 Tax=Mycobacterium sp. IDR2000157661 TaxID=2867005 RepID=UPI00351D69AB
MSRALELGAVAELLASARMSPSTLIFEGEPGIGKTTVWTAALESARRGGFRVLSTRPAAAESVLAYSAMADMLSGAEPADWTDLPLPQRLALDAVTLRASPSDIATDPRAVATGFLSVVTRLATGSPVLLAIDDLQWLDSSSSAALAFVARRLTGCVGLLFTHRAGSAGATVAGQIAVDGSRHVRRIRLSPLDLAGTRAVVAHSSARVFPRPTMVRIHEISGGNPFYALELARAVDDDHDGQLGLLPPTLSGLVRARVDGLCPDVRAVLLAAASASSPTVDVVARAVRSSAARVTSLVESAEANNLVEIRGAALRFTHPLLCWGVYTDADPAARRTMHRRLSEIIDDPEPRARHLALAATEPDDQTIEALDTAAELARIRGAPAAAAELIEMAVALGADTPQRRIALASNSFTAGDSTAARAQLEEVAAAPAPGAHRAQALTLLAVIELTDGSWAAGIDRLVRALVEAGADAEQRARILVPLALAQLNAGQLEAAARSIADAVGEATTLHQAQLSSSALSMQVIVNFLLGDGVDDEAHARAVSIEPHDVPVWVQLRPTVHRASLLAWTGQHDAAHHLFRAIRKDLIERGEESELMFVAFLSVLNETWRGDFANAGSITADALERASHLDGWLPMGVALMLRALLDAYAGREADARRHIGQATEAIRRSGSTYLITWLHSTAGFLEVSLGRFDAALDVLEPVLRRVEQHPRGTEIFVAWFLPDAVEALLHTGRLDDAEALVEILEGNGRRLNREWMLTASARCRAMLLAARGDVDAASEAANRALTEHDRLPMPFERARTLLLWGQIQRRQRDKNADATLREALRVFDELGTALWADRARAELNRRTSGVVAAAELTPSERRVAELLASGMTRREVAAALFISPKTVEAHLARIYRKLGIRSRAELGRYMANP